MANTLAYAQIFQANLDKLLIAESSTGWMELNGSQVQYNGGDTVNIPDVTFTGLGAYDRNTGYGKGSITLKWAQYKLSQDRGTSFLIDNMDIDESGFVVQAGNMLAEFQRTIVVPHVDAYRYAKLATTASAPTGGGKKEVTFATATPTADEADNLYLAITQAIAEVKDQAPNQQVVLTTTTIVLNTLKRSKMFQQAKNTTVISKGGVDYTVNAIDDVAIIEASSAIFNEDFTVDASGVVTKPTKPLTALITATGVPIAVSKTDKVRIFTPDQVQEADAYKIVYRKFHELWVLKNKTKAVKTIVTKVTAP